MKKVLFVLLIVTNVTVIQAQGEFIHGYLILANGDTLKGKIQNSQNYELTNSVNVKIDNEIYTYVSDSILQFCFEDNKCFRSFMVEEERTSVSRNLQYIIRGDISLLLLHEKRRTRIFISNKNNELFELYETFEQVGNAKRRNNEYISSLRIQMQDQPYLFYKIDQTKLSIKDVAELVREYNWNKNPAENETFRFKSKTVLTPIVYFGLSGGDGYRGGVGIKFHKPEQRNNLLWHTGVYYRTSPWGHEKGDFELVFPLILERRPGKAKTNFGIYGGLAPVFYSGLTRSGAFFGYPEERYYGFYPLGITVGMNYDFFVFNRINLFTDVNYAAGALSFSLGYGF
jgi:hypothetical protein